MITIRNSKLYAIFAAYVFAALSALDGISAADPVKKIIPPNIVFFLADDMTTDMFNCLPQGKGKNLTPNIDRLAREGTLLTQQYVVSPVCTPSRYNCLTGRYASRARNPYFLQTTRKNEGQTYVEFNSHLLPSDITLPKLLQQGGYKTGLVGKNHVVEVRNMKKFADFDASAVDPQNAAVLKSNYELVCSAVRNVGFDYAESVYHNNPDFIGLREVAVQNMDWITKGAIDFVDRYHGKPFFLYFATTVPHDPTEAARSWNANPLITAEGYLDKPLCVQPARHTIPERLEAAGIPVTDETANTLWLDDALGALIQRLEKYGLMDNTVIFFLSDHGQTAKGTLYQGGVRNPSIVWRKGGFACGSTNSALVSNVDFAPTILSMAGISYDPEDFDGQSFLPILGGVQQKEGRVLYHELGYARAVRCRNWKYLAVRYPQKYEKMSAQKRKQVLDSWNAGRRRRHMAIVTEDSTRPFSHLTAIPGGGDAERSSTGHYPGYFDRDQLYDLSKDPQEQNNLAGNPEYAEKLAEMRQLLEKQVQVLPGKFGEFGD